MLHVLWEQSKLHVCDWLNDSHESPHHLPSACQFALLAAGDLLYSLSVLVINPWHWQKKVVIMRHEVMQ